MKNWLFLIFSTLMCFSCKKAEERTCWKSAGDEMSLEIPLDDFDKLLLREHIVFELIQDSLNKLVITGGKNLIQHIEHSISDGKLEIANANKCNFIRSYKKKVKVEIHFTDLINLHFEGTEPLKNKDTLQLGYFTFLLRDGSAHVDLNFNATTLNATISHGYGDFNFSGKVNYANLNIRSNGYCNTYGLQIIDSITVINNSQGDVKVNASATKLKAEIDMEGNIYYKGYPGSIINNTFGTGKLIDDN